MSFHIVVRGTQWKPGTIFEKFDYGVQQVQTETVNNRIHAVKHVGFVYPFSEIEPFTMRMQVKGLDRHLQQ